jgi:hypothetical protein
MNHPEEEAAMDRSSETLPGTRFVPRRSRSAETRVSVGSVTQWAAACITMAIAAATVASAAPSTGARGVSPGSDAGVLIGNSCPTFSWTAVEGADAYELVVYDVGGLAWGASPAIAERIPGGALSWSPSLERCFERGVTYAWSVRAAIGDGVSQWAEPLFFAVTAEPSAPDVAGARDHVGRPLAAWEGERVATGQRAARSESWRTVERSEEDLALAAADRTFVRQAWRGAVGSTAAKVTVVGEVRTVDSSGMPRLWGRGREFTSVYPKAISPGTFYCHNADTAVTFGLSTTMVDWGSAADACPAGTWVCEASDIEACDTERPDEEYDGLDCDGSTIDVGPTLQDGGWVVGSSAALAHRGLFQFENGTSANKDVCETWPVWCCWE